MINDLARAVGDLRDPRLWGIALRAGLLTVLLLGAAFLAAGWALGVGADLRFSLPLLGEVALAGAWIGAAWAIGAVVGGALLMPAVAAAFVGLMLDAVAEAVEARDYPALPPATPAPLGAQLLAAGRLLLWTIALNLLGVVVWIVATPLAPFAFIALNGWLLGREYLELVALRRMGAAEAALLRRRWRLSAWSMGCGVAALMLVPLAGLMAPMLGVAAATHLYHRATAGAGGGDRRP